MLKVDRRGKREPTFAIFKNS